MGCSKVTTEIQKRKKRDLFEITGAILNITKDGAKRTQILYSANLSYLVLHKYLQRLLRLGFVTHNRSSGVFSLTERGLMFLDYFDDMKSAEESYLKRRRTLERLSSE